MGSAICNHVSYNLYNTLEHLKVMILLNILTQLAITETPTRLLNTFKLLVKTSR